MWARTAPAMGSIQSYTADFKDADIDEGVLTPLFKQYYALKLEHPGCLMLMRVGDFYECYGEDAVTLARDAEIVLTAKEAGGGRKIPMSGVPFFSLDTYLRLLVEAGQRVALAEQMEDAKEAKGLVTREVVRILTAGTITDPGLLDEKAHNFLAAVVDHGGTYGCAFADISTGEFLCTELGGEEGLERLEEELIRMRPAELISGQPGELEVWASGLAGRFEWCFTTWEQLPDLAKSRELLGHTFPEAPLRSLDLEEAGAATRACGLLLRYLQMTQGRSALSLSPPRRYRRGQHMTLDATTVRNLELVETLLGRERRGSLLWACDQTVTSMGARRLKQWLLHPLMSRERIEERFDAVEAFVEFSSVRREVRERLKGVADLERLTTRIVYGSANARDLLALADSLGHLPKIEVLCSRLEPAIIGRLTRDFQRFERLRELLDEAVAEDPPVSLREGGLIAPGHSEELDELRGLRDSGRSFIESLQEREREATGIRSLKIGFNQVFGYYIEVTKANLASVPEQYIRKQTLANAERYFTPELKEYESKVLGAQERIRELEYQLFTQVRERCADYAEELRGAARALSELDVLGGFAEGASRFRWARPRTVDDGRLEIRGGRHPVVERARQVRFVPNDLLLDERQRCIVLTGPNMSGKSTYLRQNALIVILAQSGCFVPADDAVVGIADRVFTRVGASDDLHLGQSTFMMEMSEAANILRHATPRSLVILDEIGRGTSTYDGLSLAQAIAEYLYHEARCKTLFATHFHELTHLAKKLKGCRNQRVAVREELEKVTFLHRIVPGGADRSYGIHVAALAGVPEAVLTRAKHLLERLERGQAKALDRSAPPALQLGLFDEASEEAPGEAAGGLRRALDGLDLEELTPEEALRTLGLWKASDLV